MELQTTIYLVVGADVRAVHRHRDLGPRRLDQRLLRRRRHGVHPVVNGMATAADWMSAASFLSMAGLIAGMGYGGGRFT
jgi:cation/acetate symporter